MTAYWLRAAKLGGNASVADRMVTALIRGAALNLSNMENFGARARATRSSPPGSHASPDHDVMGTDPRRGHLQPTPRAVNPPFVAGYVGEEAGYVVQYEDEGLRVATADNLCMSAWFAAPDLHRLRVVDRIYKTMRRRTDKGGVFMSIAVVGVPRFTAEVRKEAARQTAATGPRDLVTCHLILLDGMTGSAIRAFMSTFVLIGRPAHPTKVFGDARVASRWVAGLVPQDDGTPWSPDQIDRLICTAIARV